MNVQPLHASALSQCSSTRAHTHGRVLCCPNVLDERRCQASHYRTTNAGNSTYYGACFFLHPQVGCATNQAGNRQWQLCVKANANAHAFIMHHTLRVNAKLTNPAQSTHTRNVPNERSTKTKRGEGSLYFTVTSACTSACRIPRQHARQHATRTSAETNM